MVVSQVILGVLEKPVPEHVQVVLLVYWNNTFYCTVLFLYSQPSLSLKYEARKEMNKIAVAVSSPYLKVEIQQKRLISGPTQKEITSQTDKYLVILSSKTYVFKY